MALPDLKDESFCADLKAELELRTMSVAADSTIPIIDRLGRLEQVTGQNVGFNIGAALGSIERSAKEQTVIGALVSSTVTPVHDSVFLGYLNLENPIEMNKVGRFSINVLRGSIARVQTTSRHGDGGRFEIKARAPFWPDAEDPYSVGESRLSLIQNTVRPEERSFTAHAENVLAQASGLDFKIVHQGLNLPVIEPNGDISNTHDRLNIIKGLGENTFKAMWASVAQSNTV